jgi:hypothetical protein
MYTKYPVTPAAMTVKVIRTQQQTRSAMHTLQQHPEIVQHFFFLGFSCAEGARRV